MSINIKVAGAWKSAVPKVKVAGAWKDVSQAYVKVSGVWKELLSVLEVSRPVAFYSDYVSDSPTTQALAIQNEDGTDRLNFNITLLRSNNKPAYAMGKSFYRINETELMVVGYAMSEDKFAGLRATAFYKINTETGATIESRIYLTNDYDISFAVSNPLLTADGGLLLTVPLSPRSYILADYSDMNSTLTNYLFPGSAEEAFGADLTGTTLGAAVTFSTLNNERTEILRRTYPGKTQTHSLPLGGVQGVSSSIVDYTNQFIYYIEFNTDNASQNHILRKIRTSDLGLVESFTINIASGTNGSFIQANSSFIVVSRFVNDSTIIAFYIININDWSDFRLCNFSVPAGQAPWYLESISETHIVFLDFEKTSPITTSSENKRIYELNGTTSDPVLVDTGINLTLAAQNYDNTGIQFSRQGVAL